MGKSVAVAVVASSSAFSPAVPAPVAATPANLKVPEQARGPTREAAQNINRKDKAVSPTYFNT